MRLYPAEQFGEADLEPSGNLLHVQQRNVPFAALNPTHVGAVHPTEIRERFLRDPEQLPPLPDGAAQPTANIFHSPEDMMPAMHSLCLQPIRSIFPLTLSHPDV